MIFEEDQPPKKEEPKAEPKPEPKQTYEEKLYAIYQAQRTETDKFALEIAGRYEKMLSLLAGGALAVSVTFLEKIAPHPVPWSRPIIGGAWFALVLALVATLVALFQSQNALRKKIENLDREYREKLYPDVGEANEWLSHTENPFADKVVRWSSVSRWSAIAGLVLLVAFSLINFPSGEQQPGPNHDEKQKQVLEKRRQNPRFKVLRPVREHDLAAAPQTRETGRAEEFHFELKWSQQTQVLPLLHERRKTSPAEQASTAAQPQTDTSAGSTLERSEGVLHPKQESNSTTAPAKEK